jgi:hypothetical protein
MKDQIKELRVRIDGLSQLTQELKPINKNEEFKAFPEYINSKEIEKTYNSLILAKAWLGKVLGELAEKEFKIDLEKEYTFKVFKCRDEYEEVTCLGKDLSKNKKQLLYGQWLKDNTSPYSNDGKRKTVEDLLMQVKLTLFPELGSSASLGYDSTPFIGNCYQIYREILHKLAIENNWNNVYSSETLPSGNMGGIKIKKVQEYTL